MDTHNFKCTPEALIKQKRKGLIGYYLSMSVSGHS